MGRKTTITISVEVKKLLDFERKNATWDDFLLELLRKAKFADKIVAAMELEKLFTVDDAEALEKILGEVKLRWKRLPKNSSSTRM